MGSTTYAPLYEASCSTLIGWFSTPIIGVFYSERTDWSEEYIGPTWLHSAASHSGQAQMLHWEIASGFLLASHLFLPPLHDTERLLLPSPQVTEHWKTRVPRLRSHLYLTEWFWALKLQLVMITCSDGFPTQNTQSGTKPHCKKSFSDKGLKSRLREQRCNKRVNRDVDESLTLNKKHATNLW